MFRQFETFNHRGRWEGHLPVSRHEPTDGGRREWPEMAASYGIGLRTLERIRPCSAADPQDTDWAGLGNGRAESIEQRALHWPLECQA